MKKELKSVFLEKHEFENRDESTLSDYKIFWRFQFHDFNAGSELIVFLPKIPPKVDFSISTVDGINQACLMEIHEFE